mmetsp:Transcript_496/g.1782  ORF Transcript_496/g.1782 Transcript_496/m.1782 type:complete len:211 (+) Transcript_496:364-996(+)
MSRNLVSDVARLLRGAALANGTAELTHRCDCKVHPDLRFANLGLRLTQQCADLGFDARTATFDAAAHLRCAPPPAGGGAPDVVVFNKGLHDVANVGGAAYARALGRYAATVGACLAAFALLDPLPQLLWWHTLPTHFHRPQPPASWQCRTVPRVAALNEVADALVKKSAWRSLDWTPVVAACGDCTRDNRHYTHGNCGVTMAALLVNAIT